MSSESDFDIDDSDEEVVKKVTKGTTSSNAKRVMAASSPQKAVKKKRIASSDEDDDYGGGGGHDDDDDDEGDFEDTPQSGAKKTNKSKAPTSKQSAAKSTTDRPKSVAVTSKAATSVVKSVVAKTASSSTSSSTSSSSSASSSLAAVGGGDITRGANITTESAAKKLILQYLKLQNRPYSAIQVFDNLHKRIAKPTVERCLSTLSENDGGLRCKEYGKAKIYFFDQKNMSQELTSTEMDALDKTIKDMRKNLDDLVAEERKFKFDLNTIQNQPTDADLDDVLEAATTRVCEKRERVRSMGTSALPPNALRDAIKAHNFFRGKWRSRKDALLEVIDAISDGMEKKSAVVMVREEKGPPF